MSDSGAAIVKDYLKKYIYVNQLKTKQNRYIDQHLARKTLSIAFNIIHEMEDLIFSNNANDLHHIKKCLRESLGHIRKELRQRQNFLQRMFVKPQLPPDFDKCVNEAWSEVQEFIEKNYQDPFAKYESYHKLPESQSKHH